MPDRVLNNLSWLEYGGSITLGSVSFISGLNEGLQTVFITLSIVGIVHSMWIKHKNRNK